MNVSKIGETIRHLRQTRGLTLTQVAQASKLTRGYLSRVERGHRQPPIATLQALGYALGADMAEILGDSGSPAAPSRDYDLVRAEANVSEVERGAPGGHYAYKPLVRSFRNKYMAPFLMVLGQTATESLTHDSEECVYVVSGEVEIEYNGQTVLLHQGDCMYFDSRKEHRFANRKKTQAVLMAVNFNYRRF